ncbi:hypothetical protein FHETE_7801 [Fusarium heterosporum]|uniref:Uncharacterized protein n=1 Tax=Fusarium heterosporum TaxID=42747 RepID=A0A8H5SZ67_FUSHE|nr:hypothetical protein FHETE_7801 [Fusarium heterosporum]
MEPSASSQITSDGTSVIKSPIEDEPAVGEGPLFRGIPSSLSKLDGFMAHMNRLLLNRENHDYLILFLAYASHFVATALETPTPKVLWDLANRTSKLISRIAPSRLSLILQTYRLQSLMTKIPTCKMVLAERMRALSDILMDWQIITRLWGLLAMWTEAKDFFVGLAAPKAAKETDNTNLWDFVAEKAIKATYIVGLLGYYGAENVAWLNKRGVFRFSEKTESKLNMWSLKGWGVFVFSELAQLLHERSVRMRAGEEESPDERKQTRTKFVQVLLWGPLTVHWSREEGLMPEIIASFLSAYVEFLTTRGLWRGTAVS